MGDPRKLKRKYDKPKHPWQYKNLEKERRLIKDYGLKNKKEVWKAESTVRKYRKQAREIVGVPEEERGEKESGFLDKLRKIGILKENQGLEQVLSLNTKDYLERRLQTQAWKKGYGKTAKEARQLIVHGHIKMNGRRATEPGMIVPEDEEHTIDWYGEPVEQAKAKKTSEEVVEEAREEGKIEGKEKEKEREKEEETKEEEAEEEAETKEVGYSEIVKENIPDVKEKAKETELDYEKLLEAEKSNKDRKTMKKWIKRKIGD